MMRKTHKMLIFNMVMMMVFIIVITVQNVGVLKISALVDYSRETAVNAVSGTDNSEKTEVLVLEKFRVLLGLRTLQRKTKLHNAGWENGSPAPSPSPEATVSTPVPAPASAVHLHKHHRLPRPKPMLPMHKLDHVQHSKRKVIIIAVVLSTVVVLIILALGVFFITRRFNRQKKVTTRTTSVFSNEGGNKGRSKSVTSQNLASKVIHDPSFDMFYLNSLTNALEPEVCIRGDYNCVSTSTVENIGSASEPYGRNNSENEISQKGLKDTCSLAEEVISIHEYAQSCKNESDDQSSTNGDKIIGIDSHSSEDESFHSLCDSRTSSNLRLSSVSVGSFSDPVEGFSPSQSSRSLGSPNSMPKHSTENVCNLTQQTDTDADGPDCLQTLNETPQPPPRSTPSPPPPPPPPPNFRRFSPIRTGSSSQPSVKAAKSTMILHSSSPRNSSSSQVLKETPEKGMCASSSSQHSPNSLSTIPLPPFPPPSLHNHRNSFKGPPPPPSQPPPFTPMGKDGNPLPKLKPLHWDKVRATPDRSMVWDQLRCSSFELDEETIESLFGYNLKTAFTNDEGKNKNASPSKHVLEPKRLQNITILSKAVNVTAEKVCEALVQGNGLSSQQLEALVRMAPTKEEEGKLSSYKGDIDELGSAEKLVKEMVTIPCAFERVEAMLYKATFDDEVVHLRNSFSMLEEACKELRSSRLFLKLLEAVLKTGNRMNVGTIRGGARAFKLDALLKLADVKGTDGKTTLLHFVVQEIIRAEGIRMSDSIMGQIDRISKRRTAEEKEEDYKRMGLELITGLSTELCNVKRTASLDLDVLATSVSNLSDGMSKLKQLVNKDLSTTKDNFVHAMKSFMSHAESNLKELQAEENKVLQSVRQITEYYHGDVSKEEINPLRIFVVVRDFLGMLDQVCRELKTLKTPRSPNPLAPFQ